MFAAVYLTLCPALILHALGYVYRTGIEKHVFKTGLIYVSSLPSGAVVYLNNKRVPEKTPTVVRNLLPGAYTVRLHFKDYEPWMENVQVETERATALDKVLLVRQHPVRETVAAGPFRKLVPVEGARFF